MMADLGSYKVAISAEVGSADTSKIESATKAAGEAGAKDLESKIGDAGASSSSSFNDRFKKGLKIATIASAASLAAVAKIGVGWAQMAADDQASASKLATTLKNVTGATQKQIDANEDWISAQGEAYGVADDDLRPALQTLATATGSVTKAQKLATLAMNISAGSGQNLSAVSKALAKGSEGQTAALAKLNPAVKTLVTNNNATLKANIAQVKANKSLTKSQQAAKIQALTTANATKTQNSAMALLSKTYSGQAATAANTASGKMERFKLAVSETQESLGYLLLPILEKFGAILTTKAVPAMDAFVGWAQKNSTVLKIVGIALGGIAAALAIVNVAMFTYNIYTKLATAAQWLWNAAMDANPIGLIVLGITALIAVIVIIATKTTWFQTIWKAAWGGIKTAAVAVWNALKAAAIAVFNFFKTAIEAYITIWTTEWAIVKAVFVGVWNGIKGAATAVWGWLTGKVNSIVSIFTNVKSKLAGVFSGMWNGLKNSFKSVLNWIFSAWNSIHLTLPSVNTHIPGIGKVGGFTLQVPQIPLLAKGGITNGPTMAIVGDNPGGKEVISPLSKLQSMIHDEVPSAPGGAGGITINQSVPKPDNMLEMYLLTRRAAKSALVGG